MHLKFYICFIVLLQIVFLTSSQNQDKVYSTSSVYFTLYKRISNFLKSNSRQSKSKFSNFGPFLLQERLGFIPISHYYYLIDHSKNTQERSTYINGQKIKIQPVSDTIHFQGPTNSNSYHKYAMNTSPSTDSMKNTQETITFSDIETTTTSNNENIDLSLLSNGKKKCPGSEKLIRGKCHTKFEG